MSTAAAARGAGAGSPLWLRGGYRLLLHYPVKPRKR